MSIDKNGIWLTKNFSEYIVEPDGSKWVQISHQSNADTKKFSSSNDFANGVYLDCDRWFNAGICNELSSWEFLWIQHNTIDSKAKKFRWTQSVNPFTGTYDDIAPGKVTYNTSPGYEISTMGGIYKFNSSAYFVVANSTRGNWFGAVAAWDSWSGGIPGHPSYSGPVTTGAIDLYVRVDNTVLQMLKIGVDEVSELIEF